MVAAIANSVAIPIPITMYPIWLTMWKLKMRFICACEIAPSKPMIIVRPATTINSVFWSPGKSSVSVRMSAYTPTLVSKPANTAVTELGEVGYESGNQKNSGNTAALIPNATSSNRFNPSRTPSGSSASLAGSSAMLTVPVAAKIRPTAKRSSSDSTTLSTT